MTTKRRFGGILALLLTGGWWLTPALPPVHAQGPTTPEAWIDTLYQALYGRPGSDLEVALQLERLAAAGPAAVAVDLIEGDEFQRQVLPVLQLYVATFEVLPSTIRRQTLLQRHREGESLASLAAEFVPGLGVAGNDPYVPGPFMANLYRRVLQREPDPAGASFWVHHLAAGAPPGVILSVFVASPEYQARTGHEVALRLLAQGVFQRAPGPNLAQRAQLPLATAVAEALADPSGPPAPQPLRAFASSAALAEYLLNARALGGFRGTDTFAPAPEQGGNAPTDVSTTNLQEVGVDEADRIKSDGEYLYMLTAPEIPFPPIFFTDLGEEPPLIEPEPPQLVTSTLETAGPREVHRQPLDSAYDWQGLYLDATGLVALGTRAGWSYGFPEPTFGIIAPVYAGPSATALTFYNRTSPAVPDPITTLTFDGELLSSRRLGDTLYLVLRHAAWEQVVPFAEGAMDLAAIDLPTWLPRWRRDGEDQGELVAATQCYRPTLPADAVTPELTVIVALDAASTNPTPVTRCMVGPTETVYASTEALYLATTAMDYALPVEPDGDIVYPPEFTTDIHKFALDGGVAEDLDYRGTGMVIGHLGWNLASKAFRLGERDGVLAVASSLGDTWGGDPRTRLTLLQEGPGDVLDTVATLPNEQRPDPIGKPGERLYGVRYNGQRAYLVTFRIIDPLYIVDLSDPQDPFIAGELAVPGYADYLQVVGDGLLLGVGKDAVPDPEGEFRGAWYQGLQLTLIDVADPRAPTLLERLVIGGRGTETDLFQDHHALAWLPPANGAPGRLALPVRLHDIPPEGDDGMPWQFYQWSETALQLFEIDPQVPSLVPVGRVVDPGAEAFEFWDGSDRALLVNDQALYIRRDEVLWAPWP
ncbi:MAG: beta-propeller domain-containing protein [Candidatus Competibacterales bacterium]